MSFNKSRINILSLVTAMMARAFSGVKGPERGTAGTTGASGAPETGILDARLDEAPDMLPTVGVAEVPAGMKSRGGTAAGVKPGLSPFG